MWDAPLCAFVLGVQRPGGLSYVLYLMGSADALKLKFYKEKGLEGGFLFSWYK